MVTRARVTEDGMHLCIRVERGDPVYTNEFEHAAWDLVVDLPMKTWAPVPPPGEKYALGASKGPYPLMFVQHMSAVVEPAEGLPWRRSRTLDIFHTEDSLIDLRGATPQRRPLPYLDTSQLVFLR